MRYLDDGDTELMLSPDPPYQDPDTQAFDEAEWARRHPGVILDRYGSPTSQGAEPNLSDWRDVEMGGTPLPPAPDGAVPQDQVQTVPSAMPDHLDSQDQGPDVAATGPANPPSSYQTKLEQLEQAVGQRPTMNRTDENGKPIQPKWWQRAAAMGAGALAGYSNAAGRTRTPINIEAMGEKILHPTYQTRLQDWQGQVQPLEAQAQIEGEKQKAAWEGLSKAAQADYYRAHADYMRGQGRGEVEVTPELAEMSGGVFRPGMRISSSTATELARIAAGKYQKPELGVVVKDPGLAKILGVGVGDRVPNSAYTAAVGRANPKPAALSSSDRLSILAAGGDPDNPPPPGDPWWKTYHKLSAAPNPLADALREQNLREGKLRDTDTVNNKKAADERNALNDMDRKINEVRSKTTDQTVIGPAEALIRKQAAGQLQSISDNYANQVEARGGQGQRYDVNPDTLQYTPRGGAPSAAPQPKSIDDQLEGKIAVNKKTGERLVRRGGQWLPLR